MELYGLPPGRVAVIRNGISREFWEREEPEGRDAVRKRFDLPNVPYILFVGGADPRKNHRTFLQAFAGRREDLRGHVAVLVGDLTHRFGSFRETARLVGLTREVVYTGRVSADDLKLLYREADVFVFPSLYEGFGIPVLEAMACGTPVITSSSSSLQEVAGDAAWLVDPLDAAAMGQAMVTLSRDEQLREQLRFKGFLRVKQFDWMHAASQTLALYRELCA